MSSMLEESVRRHGNKGTKIHSMLIRCNYSQADLKQGSVYMSR